MKIAFIVTTEASVRICASLRKALEIAECAADEDTVLGMLLENMVYITHDDNYIRIAQVLY